MYFDDDNIKERFIILAASQPSFLFPLRQRKKHKKLDTSTHWQIEDSGGK